VVALTSDDAADPSVGPCPSVGPGPSVGPAAPRLNPLVWVEKLSHRVLLAWGARSLLIPTVTGAIHAYAIPGRGEGTFVLIHGLGANATGWTNLVAQLRKHARRIVLVELPGHGRSAPPPESMRMFDLASSVRDAIDTLLDVRDPAIVLGNSLGGATALRYALWRPEHVRCLLLNSPAGAPLEPGELDALRTRFGVKTRADARRFLAELLHSPPGYFRLIEAGLAAELGRPLIQNVLHSVRDEDFFTAEELATLAVPTVLMWGKSDRILPPSGLAFYRRALPAGTQVEEVDGVGHSIHLERPRLVLRRLLEARDRARA
jgi:pimeloyl-ACP methyl ester carboxylesterase